MTALPPPPHETPADAGQPKRWQAGTLTYTKGSLALLFFWLLWGDFAWALQDRTVPPVVQLLFRHFGASDTLVGLLFASLPAAIGLVLMPLVGYRSDRLRSRWGRRIPFLLGPIPFIVLSMVGLAFAPRIGSALGRLSPFSSLSPELLVLTALGVGWTMFQIGSTVANSVFGALINDVVPQEVIGRFFGLFRAFSLLAGILLNYAVMGKAESHSTGIFLGVGLLYGIGFLLMCLKVKEGSYPPPPAPAPERDVRPGRGLLSPVRLYFKDSLGHPYYRWFFAATLFCLVSIAPFNIYSVFYAKSLGMEMDVFFKCIAASFGVSLVLAYPLGVLVDRFHPLQVGLVVIALYGLTMLWGIVFVKDAASFLIVLMAHTILSGTYFTAVASLGQRLLPRTKFAEIASAGSVLGSLATIAMPPLLGCVLDRSGHHYAYVFYAGLALTAAGIASGCVLHRKFVALGGPARYRAPE